MKRYTHLILVACAPRQKKPKMTLNKEDLVNAPNKKALKGSSFFVKSKENKPIKSTNVLFFYEGRFL